MKVRDIMTSDVVTASPDSTLEEVASMMKEEDTGAIPVLDEDQLVGIITDRDIVLRCIAEGKDPTETNVEDILSDAPATIEPDEDVEEAARLMSERQIRRLPVVQGGALVGIISLGDIAIKEVDDEPASEALEGVSRGVKRGSSARRERQPGASEGKRKFGKTQSASLIELEEVEDEAEEYSGDEDIEELRPGMQRGASRSGRATSNASGRASSGGPQGRTRFGGRREQTRKSTQSTRSAEAGGISNRNLREEGKRQQKVASTGRQGKPSGKRRAS